LKQVSDYCWRGYINLLRNKEHPAVVDFPEEEPLWMDGTQAQGSIQRHPDITDSGHAFAHEGESFLSRRSPQEILQ